MSGGEGIDTFVFNSLDEQEDEIIDFQLQDLIDLSGILNNTQFSEGEPSQKFEDFIKLEQVGADTKIQIDKDGAVATEEYVAVALLKNTLVTEVSSRNFIY